VQEVKKDGLALADLIGSIFTSIFVVFGLFSIAAGILLIFLIFVMLAAERRAEMGMARAIGTKRRHLVMQFLFEGYVYDLCAALVGMLLGILVGLGMVKVMAALFGQADFTLQSHIEPRSLVVAFCLGALVTFVTVVFSAFRVSRLNIVAAIRDLPESFGVKTGLRDAFSLTGARFAKVRRSKASIVFWAIGILPLAIPATPIRAIAIVYLVLRILWLCRAILVAFVSRGPLLLVVGAILIALAAPPKSEFLLTLGISFLLIGVAMLLRWIMAGMHVPEDVRNRIGFSLAGILLVIFWLLPFGALDGLGVPDYGGGVEMFFVSGMMLVIGGVWTVMFNSDLITNFLMAIFGSRGHLAPIIKTAVTYPMQQKFRTGLTLGMFSLVIFTLMVMSVLTRSTSGSLDLDRDIGGYQIFGAVNPQNPIQNIQQTISSTPGLKDITAAGGITQVSAGVRQPGQDNQSWQSYLLNVADDGYLGSTRFILHSRAKGYGSDATVWQTLRTTPGYAVVDASLVPFKNGGGRFGGGFTISGIHYEDKAFTAPVIEVRDAGSGAIARLKVIGVLYQSTQNVTQSTMGIYTGEKTVQAAGLPQLLPNLYFFRVAPGADVHATALTLGKTFLSNGLDVKESQKEYDTNQAISLGLNYLLQGFMALGLVVGIAALGVIAFRSVVERRQQIGVMRAIGFQRSMIRTSFLLESSFVAILGTLLGVVLGLVLAKNLVDSFAKSDNSVTLQVPWLQILLIVLLAYIASLLTTYVPAWQASRVYPAEALRYE
jgi:putative ABC transport system permease protein